MLRFLKNILKRTYWHFRAILFIIVKTFLSRELKINKLGTVIIISPHPDDESLGCAMLIKSLANNSHNVEIIFLSQGEKSICDENINSNVIAQIRKNMAIKANRLLGVEENNLHFFNFPDGDFANVSNDTLIELGKVIDDIRPDTIFIPHTWEQSPDHLFATKILMSLVGQKYRLMYYCVWIYYHMSILKIFRLNILNSFIHKGDITTKREIIELYLSEKDGKGNCFSGFLPQEFLDAIGSDTELYFEVGNMK